MCELRTGSKSVNVWYHRENVLCKKIKKERTESKYLVNVNVPRIYPELRAKQHRTFLGLGAVWVSSVYNIHALGLSTALAVRNSVARFDPKNVRHFRLSCSGIYW
jgi:hypothetical protein